MLPSQRTLIVFGTESSSRRWGLCCQMYGVCLCVYVCVCSTIDNTIAFCQFTNSNRLRFNTTPAADAIQRNASRIPNAVDRISIAGFESICKWCFYSFGGKTEFSPKKHKMMEKANRRLKCDSALRQNDKCSNDGGKVLINEVNEPNGYFICGWHVSLSFDSTFRIDESIFFHQFVFFFHILCALSVCQNMLVGWCSCCCCWCLSLGVTAVESEKFIENRSENWQMNQCQS